MTKIKLSKLAKNQFIETEIWNMSWAAAVQRGNVYIKNASPDDKAKCKDELKVLLLEKINTYKSDEPHTEFLDQCQKGSNKLIQQQFAGKVFEKDEIRVGTIQKLVNLYLKYQWCMGLNKNPPPHCPIDRNVIGEINKDKDIRQKLNDRAKEWEDGNKGKSSYQISWVIMDDWQAYEDIIQAIQLLSRNMTIAEWELQVFNKIRGENKDE